MDKITGTIFYPTPPQFTPSSGSIHDDIVSSAQTGRSVSFPI